MLKDFDTWSFKKKQFDKLETFQHPKEGEVWWCRVGINIGTEVCGKGASFSRPVLIVNAEAGQSCIGIPLTSKIKSKKYACIIKTVDGKLHTALVYQIRNFDKRRLEQKIYELDAEQFAKVKTYFNKLYKI